MSSKIKINAANSIGVYLDVVVYGGDENSDVFFQWSPFSGLSMNIVFREKIFERVGEITRDLSRGLSIGEMKRKMDICIPVGCRLKMRYQRNNDMYYVR